MSMEDERRRQLNRERLNKIHSGLRMKIGAVLLDIERHALPPLIDGAVWRSIPEQAALVKRGVSKVRFSYHNCTTPDGHADSLAADIIHASLCWDASQSFWLMLASSAQAHGLEWGGYWGLSLFDRRKLRDAIDARDWTRPGLRLGWDTAHIQVSGISLRAARRGVRPKTAL